MVKKSQPAKFASETGEGAARLAGILLFLSRYYTGC